MKHEVYENKIDIIPNVDRATSSPLFKSLSFSKNATKTIKIEKNTSPSVMFEKHCI